MTKNFTQLFSLLSIAFLLFSACEKETITPVTEQETETIPWDTTNIDWDYRDQWLGIYEGHFKITLISSQDGNQVLEIDSSQTVTVSLDNREVWGLNFDLTGIRNWTFPMDGQHYQGTLREGTHEYPLSLSLGGRFSPNGRSMSIFWTHQLPNDNHIEYLYFGIKQP